jgi:hypothetical protein
LLPLGCSFYYLHHTNRGSVLSIPYFLSSKNVRSIVLKEVIMKSPELFDVVELLLNLPK